jgi:hypothetical protein
MKVHIGPSPSWIGPYQIAEKILFWKDKYHDDLAIADKHSDQIHALGTWLSGSDDKPSLLLRFCQWVYNKRKRKVKIHIDNYDTWSADHSLALIIHPLLVRLKEDKPGAPKVDDKDVPKYLRSTSAPELTEEEKNCGATDDNWFKRWDYVLDEMIWTFEQHADPDWESKFYSGECDIDFVKMEGTEYSQMVKGPKDTFKVDNKAMTAAQTRMANGRRLFAKYYLSLWN